MKPLLQLAGVVGLLLLWGQAQVCSGIRAAQVRAARDSLAAGRAAFNRALGAFRARDAVRQDSLGQLAQLETGRREAWGATRDSTRAAIARRDSLRARVVEVALPDSLQALLGAERAATGAAQAEAEACSVVAVVCTARRALLERQLGDYQVMFTGATARVDTLERRLDQELRRRTPRRCGLGWGAGYGVALVEGSLRTGPTLQAGLSCQVLGLF